MRLLPLSALVLASLVFTTGGVAIVGRADSQDPAPKAQSDTALFESTTPMTGCAEPQHHDVRIPSDRFARGPSVQLNTHGYNYAGPGELQMDPSGRTPPGQLPAESLPAAPAKP